MNISLVDAGDAGNLDRVSKSISAEIAGDVASAAEKQNQHQSANQAGGEDDEDSLLPARMRGKTRAEIAEMYANLESANGRMANELGTQRQLTDRLLDLKRTTDLAGNDPAVKPAKITREEILADDPTPSIERIIDARLGPLVKALDQRLGQVDANTAQAQFNSRHADANAIAADPKFAKWLSESPLRLRAAQSAKSGDWAVADDLLTEYKTATRQTKQPVQDNSEVDLEAARAAGFESGSSNSLEQGGNRKGKIYNRNDLIKLRMDDPETYYSDDFQAVILKAYHEKRVK